MDEYEAKKDDTQFYGYMLPRIIREKKITSPYLHDWQNEVSRSRKLDYIVDVSTDQSDR